MMQKHLSLLFIVLPLLIAVLTGCTTTPDIREINEIPEGAVEIMTSKLTGQSGTYTDGSISVTGTGYIVFEVQLDSGSMKQLAIKETATDEVVYFVSKPNTALYDSGYYEFRADTEYKLSFVDAKELHGSVTVYFVAE